MADTNVWVSVTGSNGEEEIRLQEAHAQALRLGDAASCRACAALCARWLWTARAVGLPRLATVGNND